MQAIDEYRQIAGQLKLTAEEQAEIEERSERLKSIMDELCGDPLTPEKARQLIEEQRKKDHA